MKSIEDIAHDYMVASIASGDIMQPPYAIRLAEKFVDERDFRNAERNKGRTFPELNRVAETEVTNLIMRGLNIEAIKSYRLATGATLKDAKERVCEVSDKVRG